MKAKVPFLDLNAHHLPLRAEIDRTIGRIIDSGIFAGGPVVAEFEEAFAQFCESPFAIGVGSGTEALWLALLACGVGPGDEVITVPNTFMATAEAITYAGAKPVFVDIDEASYTMDPARLEDALTPRTKAIIPVHLFGQTAHLEPILQFAQAKDLYLIEDAAQAHGAECNGRKVGSLGHVGCFSFYPGKNLGAFGEAGAIVTADAGLKDKITILRDHGQVKKYYHQMVGWNCRMDAIQAAVLGIKLAHLDDANTRRRAHANQYDQRLAGHDQIITPWVAPYGKHVYHIYAVRVQNRDRVKKQLEDAGIESGIHYPVSIHLQLAYADLGYKPGSLPVAERVSREMLSLPMFPELMEEDIDFVCDTLLNATVVDFGARPLAMTQ
ncbi:MAG: DegT/DnrJ/EryC1/StrS family aminotransferase [Verrucomicrobiota bacterium]|nr:DegT/DnrJ/EryC1/StrS family aminotransferase [Chthoniobacterales bacterium]MDQ3413740.1 DegT/DnrJ/EryC1/StrS family aminotransferase [Verrucomicrobiota bacterium]